MSFRRTQSDALLELKDIGYATKGRYNIHLLYSHRNSTRSSNAYNTQRRGSKNGWFQTQAPLAGINKRKLGPTFLGGNSSRQNLKFQKEPVTSPTW